MLNRLEIDEHSKLYYLLNALIGAYNRRTDTLAKSPTSDASIVQKLDVIIETQKRLAIDFALFKEEISLIHGLVADLVSGGDPEKLKEITQNIKTARERLQTSVNNQTKGDK